MRMFGGPIRMRIRMHHGFRQMPAFLSVIFYHKAVSLYNIITYIKTCNIRKLMLHV